MNAVCILFLANRVVVFKLLHVATIVPFKKSHPAQKNIKILILNLGDLGYVLF